MNLVSNRNLKVLIDEILPSSGSESESRMGLWSGVRSRRRDQYYGRGCLGRRYDRGRLCLRPGWVVVRSLIPGS